MHHLISVASLCVCLSVFTGFGTLAQNTIDDKKDVVRIVGAFEPARNTIAPRIGSIKEAAGIDVALSGATSRDGLRALLAGEADAALISGPLRSVCDGDDDLASAVKAAGLRPHLIGSSELKVVVNAYLGIDRLDRTQIAALFGGDIDNWSDLGGPRIGVTILGAADGDGADITLRRRVLRGEALSDDARSLKRADFILRAISGRAGAIGVVDAASLQGARNVVALETDVRLAQPVFLVVRPDAGEAVSTLIARSNAFFAPPKGRSST